MIRNHSNCCGNVCAQLMMQIVLLYFSYNHDVVKELEKKNNKAKVIERIKKIHHNDRPAVTVLANNNFVDPELV